MELCRNNLRNLVKIVLFDKNKFNVSKVVKNIIEISLGTTFTNIINIWHK